MYSSHCPVYVITPPPITYLHTQCKMWRFNWRDWLLECTFTTDSVTRSWRQRVCSQLKSSWVSILTHIAMSHMTHLRYHLTSTSQRTSVLTTYSFHHLPRPQVIWSHTHPAVLMNCSPFLKAVNHEWTVPTIIHVRYIFYRFYYHMNQSYIHLIFTVKSDYWSHDRRLNGCTIPYSL